MTQKPSPLPKEIKSALDFSKKISPEGSSKLNLWFRVLNIPIPNKSILKIKEYKQSNPNSLKLIHQMIPLLKLLAPTLQLFIWWVEKMIENMGKEVHYPSRKNIWNISLRISIGPKISWPPKCQITCPCAKSYWATLTAKTPAKRGSSKNPKTTKYSLANRYFIFNIVRRRRRIQCLQTQLKHFRLPRSSHSPQTQRIRRGLKYEQIRLRIIFMQEKQQFWIKSPFGQKN